MVTWEAEIKRFVVQRQTWQIVHQTLSQKIQKRAGGVAQVVECLPCKLEALNSNPVLPKK
jgi:hypothetical protein